MTKEDRQELRAMLVDVIGAAVGTLQTELGGRILNLQADMDLALDRLDTVEADLKGELRELRSLVVRMRRERIREVREEESYRDRLARIEARLVVLEKLGGLGDEPSGGEKADG